MIKHDDTFILIIFGNISVFITPMQINNDTDKIDNSWGKCKWPIPI